MHWLIPIGRYNFLAYNLLELIIQQVMSISYVLGNVASTKNVAATSTIAWHHGGFSLMREADNESGITNCLVHGSVSAVNKYHIKGEQDESWLRGGQTWET